MPPPRLEDAVVERLHRQGHATRWGVALDTFRAALERSVSRAFPAGPPAAREVERYLTALHLDDLALACACADGRDEAWEHFVREYRPALYRCADAIDSTGGARDLADSLYGELFGLTERNGERRSHFRYYHGRSSLATWLRAVLAQRHVDRLRSVKRLDPLPADESPGALVAAVSAADARWDRHRSLMRAAVTAAVASLAPRDRLRLGCYYGQDLTLAQIGRLLGEHEATVSRHLARARREIRAAVEGRLRDGERMSEAEVTECFASVVEDPGSLDVADMLGHEARKRTGRHRSKMEASGADRP